MRINPPVSMRINPPVSMRINPAVSMRINIKQVISLSSSALLIVGNAFHEYFLVPINQGAGQVSLLVGGLTAAAIVESERVRERSCLLYSLV